MPPNGFFAVDPAISVQGNRDSLTSVLASAPASDVFPGTR
jgi:hypothetical protein